MKLEPPLFLLLVMRFEPPSLLLSLYRLESHYLFSTELLLAKQTNLLVALRHTARIRSKQAKDRVKGCIISLVRTIDEYEKRLHQDKQCCTSSENEK
jgi:hypothetical protein